MIPPVDISWMNEVCAKLLFVFHQNNRIFPHLLPKWNFPLRNADWQDCGIRLYERKEITLVSLLLSIVIALDNGKCFWLWWMRFLYVGGRTSGGWKRALGLISEIAIWRYQIFIYCYHRIITTNTCNVMILGKLSLWQFTTNNHGIYFLKYRDLNFCCSAVCGRRHWFSGYFENKG